jgi:membrane-bound serine protease (ClpP class)
MTETTEGFVLLGLAAVLLIAEAHLATYGVLGFVGLGFFAWGAALLDVPVAAIVVGGILLAAFVAFAAQRAWRARHLPVRTGHEELVGRTGEVRAALDPEGQVFIQGALWRARVANGGGPLRPGDRVRVQSVEGLTLLVTPSAAPASEGEGEGT